jgi:hypothetical protein
MYGRWLEGKHLYAMHKKGPGWNGVKGTGGGRQPLHERSLASVFAWYLLLELSDFDRLV